MNSQEPLEKSEVTTNAIVEKSIQTDVLDDVSDGEDVTSFDSELKDFIAHISSLSSTLPITMKAIQAALEKTLETFKEFEKENVSYREIQGKEAMLIRADCAQQFEDLNKQLRSYGLAFKTIPRSYIMALTSQFDAFLGRLLRVVFLTKPELLNSSDRNLTFSQLVEFGSVEDAKEYILEKEIETALRKSHSEQFAWMESKFGIPLRKGLESWSTFIEVTERRNLFVHTGGIVSSQYLKVCKENGVNIEGISLGNELGVSPEYFDSVYNVVFEIGFKLAHVLWRKFAPSELDEADANIIAIGYDTLHEENYPLTKTIFDFSTETIKKHSRDENRRIMVVNKALAYKWSGDEKKAKSLITQEDWSATRARFRLAEAVLLDDFEEAYEIMEEIGRNHNEVAKEDYRDWPLFRTIRRERRFLELFETTFGEPCNKVEQIDAEVLAELPSESSASSIMED